MARDRKTIKKELTDAFISDPTIIALYGLVSGQTFEEQFSLVSVENVWFDNISLAKKYFRKPEKHLKLTEQMYGDGWKIIKKR